TNSTLIISKQKNCILSESLDELKFEYDKTDCIIKIIKKTKIIKKYDLILLDADDLNVSIHLTLKLLGVLNHHVFIIMIGKSSHNFNEFHLSQPSYFWIGKNSPL